MARKFSELRAKITPEVREESVEIEAALRTELPLYPRMRVPKVAQKAGSPQYENAVPTRPDRDTCAVRINVATYLQLDMGASMTVTTLSSREFNQDTSRAKKAAQEGPVFITDRGRPAHVLLTIEAYQKLSGEQPSIVDLLAMPGIEDIEFDPPRLRGPVARPVDLT